MRVGVKLGVLDQIGLADDLAQLGEVVVAGYRDNHMGIFTAVNIKRSTERMAGAHAGGMHAANGVPHFK